MNSIGYKLSHVDNFNSGPRLYVESLGAESEEICIDDEEENYYLVELDVTSKYIVYHILLGLEGLDHFELKQIASFENKEAAQKFAKEQYYLYTGNFPFVVDGIASGYKNTGSRIGIEISEDAICRLTRPNDINMIEYIIISNGLTVEANSLDAFAEWHFYKKASNNLLFYKTKILYL